MEREPIPGECIVITRYTGRYDGKVGQRFVVANVDDSDSTFKGIPEGSSSVADGWIPWGDAEPVRFGWEYAREHVPAELAELLSACTGVEHLSLNSDVKAAIVDSLPDWRARVLSAARRLADQHSA